MVISSASVPIVKFGKSVSFSGGAGAEGEIVALRVGIWRRPVARDVSSAGGLDEGSVGGGLEEGGRVWTERVGAVEPERRGLDERAGAFGFAVPAPD
jgi:hypothetical protein